MLGVATTDKREIFYNGFCMPMIIDLWQPQPIKISLKLTSVVTLLKVVRSNGIFLSSQNQRKASPSAFHAWKIYSTSVSGRKVGLKSPPPPPPLRLFILLVLSPQLRRRRYQFLKSWLRPILIRQCKWRWCVCFINESISACSDPAS